MAATVNLDMRGQKCPVPTLKMTSAVMKKEVNPGDTMIVKADCPTFENDVREWCKTMKKVLVMLTNEGGIKTATVKI
jgi:tRNA 2-thiouridine synthesizing protein A